LVYACRRKGEVIAQRRAKDLEAPTAVLPPETLGRQLSRRSTCVTLARLMPR
jgi:hypothetical protein